MLFTGADQLASAIHGGQGHFGDRCDGLRFTMLGLLPVSSGLSRYYLLRGCCGL
jgi:hypothetical protein